MAVMSSTKFSTMAACWRRCTSLDRFGGWNRPYRGWSPPLEFQWLPTTKTVSPWNVNSPTSGFRLALNAELFGSMRPGLSASCGTPPTSTTELGVVASPPGRSTKATPVSVRNRNPTRMLPPGSPPSVPALGSIWRYSYVGPPASTMLSMTR